MAEEIREMEHGDAARACALTDQEDWGFEEDDFDRILDLWPRGSFVAYEGDTLVGLVTTASYKSTGWIGNVVVDEDRHSLGIGTRLVTRAIEHLEAKGIGSICLYAYEGLEGFYQRLGFSPLERYTSYRGQLRAMSRRMSAQMMLDSDLPEVSRLDEYAFGDDRSELLARLQHDFPESCIVIKSQDEVVAYAMASISIEGLSNIGPAVCVGLGREVSLMESVAVALDRRNGFLVTPHRDILDATLLDMGLQQSFSVLRMCRGPEPDSQIDTVLAIGALEKG